MESYNEEPWLYDSSNAGFIEPFPSVNTFDTDRGGNLMPTAYQQQLPEITNMPPVSSVPNLGM